MVAGRAALTEPFARALRSSRQELNGRFAEVRQRLPALDASSFSAFLRDVVDPLVGAVDAVSSGSADSAALAAYDIALELVGQRLVGTGARDGAIDSVWRQVLPAAARLVAMEPSRVIAALSNAAHHVDATPGARVGAWIEAMTRFAGDCATVEELMRVGQVAAWRAGLAHFRAGAIAAAASLPESLALQVVGAPPAANWAKIEAALLASEWYDPARPNERARREGEPPRKVATAGAFRGFGGVFLVPPLVTYANGHFHVLSGADWWILTADLFGATLHRVAPNAARLPEPTVQLPKGSESPDGPGTITSAAFSETTLAVTWSLTHQVTFFALA